MVQALADAASSLSRAPERGQTEVVVGHASTTLSSNEVDGLRGDPGSPASPAPPWRRSGIDSDLRDVAAANVRTFDAFAMSLSSTRESSRRVSGSDSACNAALRGQ